MSMAWTQQIWLDDSSRRGAIQGCSAVSKHWNTFFKNAIKMSYHLRTLLLDEDVLICWTRHMARLSLASIVTSSDNSGTESAS